jgi:hypothetical protein
MGAVRFTWSFIDVFVIAPLARIASLLAGSGGDSTPTNPSGAQRDPEARSTEERKERTQRRSRPPSNRIGWWRGNRAG